jgi:putative acetyltransferase
MYLESFPDMKEAIRLYEQNGFRYLDKPLGNTGHYACNVWMVKNLKLGEFA